ncbi:MAG: winged helix-turn-helix domain-containing protein [Acidobacteriia bacterium]|nr:winged helix-turn-helix domain-containing protein [Terriglobia bacterium]
MAAGAGDFRLGKWLVQPSLNRFVHGDTELHVRPKLMDLLVFLAQHTGEVVSKEEILEGVWAKQFMAESVLSGLMAELRRNLGDDAHTPRFVETVPKRGYRLIAPAEPVGDETAATGTAAACVLIVAGRRVPLGEGEHLIGRAPDAAVHIDSTDVSRHHAKIVVREGRASIEDLGSKNGSFVGTQRVTEPTALRNGDQVRVGGVVIAFRLPRYLQSTMTVEDG